MISLSDAIERARLAADNSGLLSAYTYDQLVQQLDFADRHSFTISLVDLGIVTKHGSDESAAHIASIIDSEYTGDMEVGMVARQSSILEDFIKVAQQYVQSPGGIWTPTSLDDEDTSDSDEFQSYLDAPLGFSDESNVIPTHDEDVSSPEFDISYVEQIQEVLEKNGISVDKDGNVKQFKSNIPGIYTKEIPLKPIPLDQAVERFTGEATAVQKEQERIKTLQDILSSLNRDFVGIGTASEDLLTKFDTSLNSIEKFRYSEQSKDENIRSIAQGLGAVRKYLTESTEPLDDLQSDLSEYSSTIQGLQSKLDNYFQSQYEKTDSKFEVVDALIRLKEMQEKDPDSFQKVISGLGGISASFREVMATMWYSKSGSSDEVNGKLIISIGEDYLHEYFEQKVGDVNLADNLFDLFNDMFVTSGKLSYHDFPVMFDELTQLTGISRDSIAVTIGSGYGVTAQISQAENISGEAGVGIPNGLYEGSFEEVDPEILEQIKSLLDEDLGYVIEDTLIPELEV